MMLVTVPQASGKAAATDQLQSCQATKNLRLLTAPEGSPDPDESHEEQGVEVDN